MSSATPGLSVGPMDIDDAAHFATTLHEHNKAHVMLARVQASFPAELTAALSRHVDPERTQAAREHVADVEKAIRGLSGRQNWLRDDDEVIDVAVRGGKLDRVIAVMFRGASGRTGRGVVGYDVVPAVERTFEAQEQARADGERARLGMPSGGDARIKEVTDAARKAVADAEQRAVEAESRRTDMEERLARLENPEPFSGYDGMSAKDVIERVKSGGRDEFGLAGLDRIRAYELSQKSPRSTVIDAVDDAKSPPVH